MTLGIITADSLAPFQHGFFTRSGGASSGVFSGLNCGPGSSDQAEAVAINRARVAKAMLVPDENILTLHQVHSNDVHIVTKTFQSGTIKGDAQVTATPGIAIGTLSADCQPVLFADAQAGVVGAAHAGWKGALNGVLQATVSAMEKLGASRPNIVAVIGPTISQKAYEVGPEFRESFLSTDPEYAMFFVNGIDDRFQFDLPAFGLHRLCQSGIGNAAWTGHCTYSDEEQFFSYRRGLHAGHADYGRLISTIRI